MAAVDANESESVADAPRSFLSVPRSWAQVTPAWMTAALSARCPGAVVDRAEVGTIAEGTNDRARVHLTYAEGFGPAAVFVKRHGRLAHRVALQALGALGTEARLAAAGERLPLAHPALYAGGVDRRRLETVVVMDDVLAGGGRPNDARRPLGVDEVRAGLEGLAGLHARYWDRSLPPALGFLRPWRLGPALAGASRLNLRRGIRKLEAAPEGSPLASRLDTRALAAQFAASAQRAASGTQTVLHGDPHPGNTYATATAGGTGFFDWQLARLGHWSHDVGYFLVGSLDIADRRAYEREILGGYLQSLGHQGALAPRFHAAWEHYRATPAFGLATWLHTLSFATFQPVDICLAMIARFAAAYEDLETAHSLRESG